MEKEQNYKTPRLEIHFGTRRIIKFSLCKTWRQMGKWRSRSSHVSSRH